MRRNYDYLKKDIGRKIVIDKVFRMNSLKEEVKFRLESYFNVKLFIFIFKWELFFLEEFLRFCNKVRLIYLYI